MVIITVISVLLFSVLTISTAMCPDKKLQWFADHDWSPATIEEIKQQVIDRWTTSYKPLASAIVAVAPAIAANAPVIMSLPSIFTGDLLTISIKLGSRWKLPPKLRSTHPLDSIKGYLAAPTIDEDEIKAMGGVMMYWYRKEESCPSLSRYGADYRSAPGKLVLLLF